MIAAVGATEEKVVVPAEGAAQNETPAKKVKYIQVTVDVEKWTAMLEAGGRYQQNKTNQFRGEVVKAVKEMVASVKKVEEV